MEKENAREFTFSNISFRKLYCSSLILLFVEHTPCLSFRALPYVLEKEAAQAVPYMQDALCIKLWVKEYCLNIMLITDIASTTGVSLPLLFPQKTEFCYHKNTFTNQCK